MDLKVIWAEPAVKSFVEQLNHIGGFSPAAAREVRRRVDLSLHHVARFPDLGRWLRSSAQASTGKSW